VGKRVTDQTARDHDSEAERLFAEWLARQPEQALTGDALASLEALCAQHPAHAAALRALHADCRRVASVLGHIGRTFPALQGDSAFPGPGLAERIRAQYGPGVDPNITLEPEGTDATPSDYSSAVLSRLSSRPDTAGRYRLQGEVARGGQGAILRVWDEDLRRHLAMKVTLGRVSHSGTQPSGAAAAPASPASPASRAALAALASPAGPASPAGIPSPARSASDTATPTVDARTVGRFLEEAQVTGQLDHPGIVPVHELGLDSHGRAFFTMKLVKGEDLKAVFARVHAGEADWSQTRALSLLLRVCEAMSYAHSKRVIHRDLKPSNIMVGRFGEVFVMDWGLARVLDRKDDKDVRVRPEPAHETLELHSERRERAVSDPESPLVTMDGDVVGTPAYMSPEQASGKLQRMGPPSDVYALGAMLYHLLTGRMPYVTPGVRVNNYAILSRVQEGPPASVASLAPQAPAELIAICEKAMAREPAARYADMSALAEDLRAYLEHRVVAAYETGAVAELRKWVVRNKPLAAALVATVLTVAIGGASFAVKAKEADEQRGQAVRNAQLAEEQRQVAQLQERVATQKTNDVLSLSAIQELKELLDRADALWPATPAQLPEYDRWLADARALVEGSAEDPARGIAAHPGLKDHEAKLAEIRRRARPITPEQVEQDRRSSPSLAEWEQSRARLTWMLRMLGDEPWPDETEVEAALAQESLPTNADGLNGLAWPLVDPDPANIVYGGEIKALLLAYRAVEAATDAERPRMRDTLAWALFRCGQSEEALAEEQRALDEADAALNDQFTGPLKQMRSQVALWAPGEPRDRQGDEASTLSVRVAELEREVNERRTFEFQDAQDRWWHAQLTQLVADLKAFADEKTGLDSQGISELHGWGIGRRAAFARSIEERSTSGAEAKRRWSEAIVAIAKSPQYAGLALTPQLGLLPIGADPDSGLQEFWHVPSGDEPQRGADGKLVLSESMGVVLVLIPGGRFWMGAQRTDPAGRNYDELAMNDEGPVHAVTLSPYFLSKYEMTQGQWERFTGRNPSQTGPGIGFGAFMTTRLHPVEQVSWDDAMVVLPRMGLQLPTEAQWECGTRGGTDTPWSTGPERESLIGAVNLADSAAARAGAAWSDIKDWPELDDGWLLHAAVGRYRPNDFGLHDVHGNLWEWCRDGYYAFFYSQSPKQDPFMEPSGDRNRIGRGGSFTDAAASARSASRSDDTPDNRDGNIGLRPARGITP